MWSKSLVREPNKGFFVDWSPLSWSRMLRTTGIPVSSSSACRNWPTALTIPEGVVLQRQVAKIIEDRRKMTAGAHADQLGLR
jgi:2-oxoglutarate dehydrogenase E1 component